MLVELLQLVFGIYLRDEGMLAGKMGQLFMGKNGLRIIDKYYSCSWH